MKETPIFGGPLPEAGDSPDGAAQISAAVEWVESILAEIEGLLLGEPKPGELLVVNGTSDPVYKAATGDVTINSAGVTAIGAGKVLEAMLGGESVATAKIKELAVTAAKIAEGAVETAKLANLGTTTGKLAELAVTAAKIAAEAVETGKIKNLAVTTAKIALEAVTTALIADGAVTSRKLKPDFTVVDSGAVEKLGSENYLAWERTPAVASIAIITGFFHCQIPEEGGIAKSQIVMRLYVDGALVEAGSGSPLFQGGVLGDAQTLTGTWQVALTAAKHTFALKGEPVSTMVTRRAKANCLIFAS